jgi:hypothetical protein
MRVPAWMVVLALGASCRSGPPLANGFPADATREELSVVQQDFNTLSVREVVELEAPGGATVTHVHLDWELNGERVGVSEQALDVPVLQDGRASFPMLAALPVAQGLEALQKRAEEGTLKLTAKGVASLIWHDAIKEVALHRTLRVPAARLLVPSVAATSGVRYGNGEVALSLTLAVHNPNGFPAVLTGVRCQVEALGTTVMEATVGQDEVIAPDSTGKYLLERLIDQSQEELLGELHRRGSVPIRVTGEISLAPYTQPFTLEGRLGITGG